MNLPALLAAAAHTGTELMADTIDPKLLPDGWPHAVLAYRDGWFAWPADQIRRFDKVSGISVTGDPAHAAMAREVDVERFDATPAEAPPFIRARNQDPRHDLDGTVYASRAKLPAIAAAFGSPNVFSNAADVALRLHIATLDDVLWTPVTLAENILRAWRIPIDPELIWAIQCFRSDPASAIYWDTSLVYGKRDFWNPNGHQHH